MVDRFTDGQFVGAGGRIERFAARNLQQSSSVLAALSKQFSHNSGANFAPDH
jgi:hypothetical protein